MQQSVKIYRVNRENYLFDAISTPIGIIEKIIRDTHLKYKSNEQVNIDSIPNFEHEGLAYYLFVYNFAEKNSEWSNFLPTRLTQSLQLNTVNLTLLLFISNGIDIFVVVGGKGFEAIIKYIDHSFGLTIVSKLINPNEDIIVSINSRGLTGARAGLSEQYRSEFRLIDYARFGKVPVEVHLILSHQISNDFFSFLQNKKDEKIKIYAGKSFKIKKNVNFEELHKVFIELGFIMEREPNDYLSTYIEIKDNAIINNQLQPLLLQALYNDREYVLGSETTDKRFKFDFCNPNKITEFYEADFYVLKEKVGNKDESKKYFEFKKVQDRGDIYESVIRRAVETIENIDFVKFRAYIQGVRVVSYIDNKIATSANFIYHFTTEFQYEEKSVFLVDTKWYVLNNSFIEDLKFECVETLKNHKLPRAYLKTQG